MWGTLSLYFSGFFVAGSFRATLPILLPILEEEYGWTSTQQGLAVSAPFLLGAVGAPVIGHAIDHLLKQGARPLATCLMIAWVPFVVLNWISLWFFGFPFALIAIRFVMGVFDMVIFSCLLGIVKKKAEKTGTQHKTLANAGAMVGGAFGFTFTYILLPLWNSILPFQSFFHILAAMATLWASAFILTQPFQRPSFTEFTLGEVVPWKDLARKEILAVMASKLVYMFALITFTQWWPTWFFQTFRLTVKEYSGLTWIPLLVSAVAGILWVLLADQLESHTKGWTRKKTLYLFPTLGLIGSLPCMMMAILWAPTPMSAVVLAAAAKMFSASGLSTKSIVHVDMQRTNEAIGLWGWFHLAANLPGALGPVLVGTVKDTLTERWTGAMVVWALLQILAWVFWIVAIKEMGQPTSTSCGARLIKVKNGWVTIPAGP